MQYIKGMNIQFTPDKELNHAQHTFVRFVLGFTMSLFRSAALLIPVTFTFGTIIFIITWIDPEAVAFLAYIQYFKFLDPTFVSGESIKIDGDGILKIFLFLSFVMTIVTEIFHAITNHRFRMRYRNNVIILFIFITLVYLTAPIVTLVYDDQARNAIESGQAFLIFGLFYFLNIFLLAPYFLFKRIFRVVSRSEE